MNENNEKRRTTDQVGSSIIYGTEIEEFENLCNQWGEILLDLVRTLMLLMHNKLQNIKLR